MLTSIESATTGSDQSLGLKVVQPSGAGVSLAAWARPKVELLDAELLEHGALLFRGFAVDDPSDFQAFASTMSGDLIDYPERAAARTLVRAGVYTSTEYPRTQRILLHHEMSYSHQWPLKIWFYCASPAAEGGCTPIADDRIVYAHLPAGIKDEFERKRVMYVRNFGQGADLSWQEAFQTQDRAAVEQYCFANGIHFEWRSRDRLRTRQVRQAVAVHPVTGDKVWFNHAHLFHWSSLDPSLQSALLTVFSKDELPRNVYFGDGSEIDPLQLAEIRRAYDEASVRFCWQRGDVLMLDNMLTVHGRDSFAGERRILVAMADWTQAT